MKVYVGQFGAIWSLTPSEWIELCEEAADTGTYDLTNYKRLKKRPQCIMNWSDEDGAEFGPVDDKTLYREPLDWVPTEFEEELVDFPKEVERITGRRK